MGTLEETGYLIWLNADIVGAESIQAGVMSSNMNSSQFNNPNKQTLGL
jgi:hypothetical protein